ncbi:MAG: helix-turn-helix transcriptional regulator [Clostridia bacterium]|nr:helix-turn-helix transcriptional regulator [Clostridia bacterium]
MNIGNKIKELRKQRGITQEQLADVIGVSFQAVSKWENNISLPDITLAPVLAGYFGVSLDDLFDYNLEKIKSEVLSIARKTVKYREKDQEEGRKIIEEGLKKFPNNDILLCNMLYLINYWKEPDKTIDIALRVIDVTKDNSTKYDALRFLAYAYKAKGDIGSARSALEQIPEIYFSRLSEMAYILSGEEKMKAAQTQKGVSLSNLIEMQSRVAECHIENGDMKVALKEYEKAIGILDLLEASQTWDSERKYFKKQISYIKEQL